MRNLKKFLALVLAMMMTLSLMVTVNAAKPVDFDDGNQINYLYKEAVDVLSALGVVKGNADDTNFRPGDTITRAEVAAIIYRVTTGDVEDKSVHLYEGTGYFTDVADGKWYDGYVNYCANNALVQGRGNGKFDPNGKVTGYEALVMILRAIGYNNPKEFSDSDWKLKASGYGRRLGITTNIAEGSLSSAATREVVAEIIFQGIQVRTVNYTLLNDYQPVIWRQGTDEDGKVLWTRYEDLLLRVFGIGGKDEEPYRDEYGNPFIQWVYWTTGKPAITIEVDPVKEFYTAIDECDLVEELNNGYDIFLRNEFLNGREVEHNPAITTGIPTDTNAYTRKLDALHTTDDYVGAQGRQTKVYYYTTTPYNTFWDIVYVDTYIGVVQKVTPVTKDTNGHVMHKAEMLIEVGAYDGSDPDANPYAKLTSNTNFTYSVGDVVLLNTWSPSYWNTANMTFTNPDDANYNFTVDWSGKAAKALNAQTLNTKASAVPNKTTSTAGLAGVRIVYWAKNNGTPAPLPAGAKHVVEKNGHKWLIEATSNGVATIYYNADGTAADKNGASFTDVIAINTYHDFDEDEFEVVGIADEKVVTVNATTGAADDKTGIITETGTFMANVVYHMHKHGTEADLTSTMSPPPTDAPSANNEVATTVKDLYNRIYNSMINKSYKLYLDEQGNILGMVPVTTPQVGVVISVEPEVRISAEKYAVEADLYMEDGSILTARFIQANRSYFGTASAATKAAVGLQVHDIVKLQSFTKDGKTYYEQIDDGNDLDSDVTTPTGNGGNNLTIGAGVDKVNDGTNNKLIPGVADALTSTYNDDLVDNDTVFFVFYKDFQYDLDKDSNKGDTTDLGVRIYRGFKNIPTISGDTDTVLYQMLDNDSKYVVIYGTDYNTAGSYDISAKETQQVEDSYLLIRPVATYEGYAEYEVMHNGVKETLKIANDNDNLNTKVELAMSNGQPFKVASWNLRECATSVTLFTDRAIKKELENVSYNGKGVLTLKQGMSLFSSSGAVDTSTLSSRGQYRTMADNVKVMIVNRANGNVYEGSLGSIEQYAKYKDLIQGNGHAFAWELDAYGYISVLYILD